MNKKLFNKGEDHQHFSLRKLTIGVASVLLGTTFMIYGGRTVQADAAAPSDQQQVTEVAKNSNQELTQQNKPAEVKNNENNVQDQKEAASIAEKTQEVSSSKTDELKVASNVNKQVNSKNNSYLQSLQQVSGNETVSDENDSTSDQSISNDEYLESTGLPEIELSDDQLEKLGLDKDTYLRDGVKYKAVGNLVLDIYDKGKVPVKNVRPPHTGSGDLMPDGEVYNKVMQYMEDNYNPDIDVESVSYTARLAPYIQGGTLYINKGHQLSDQDALHGLPDEYAKGYKNVSWDKQIGSQVNVNVPGKYDAAVDVTFDSQIGVSTDVKVVVVDLTGKDEYTHIGADIPTAESNINGAPAGSKATWTEKPSTEKPGDSTGIIEVTYPDGNKGTTKSTLHVIAPEVKHEVDVWQGDPLPEANTVVTNTGDIDKHIPGKTAYTWGNPIDTSVIGPNTTTVITHWPDGKTTTSTTTVVIKNPNQKIVDGEGTSEEVSRDIYTKLEGQNKKFDHTEKITLHRTGTKNLKTGNITWDAWQAKDMPVVHAPHIDNYVVTNPNAGSAVKADGSRTKLDDVVFNYIPDTETINTGDGTTMEVSRDIYTKLEGQTAQKVDTQKVTLHRIGTKNMVTGNITWGNWNEEQIPAYTAPKIKNYTVVNPDVGSAVKADGSKAKLANVVFNYKANHETISTGAGTTMEVSRDIYNQLEGQTAQKVDTQKVILHRTGDKNLATGKIVWGNWKPVELSKVNAEKIPGYKVSNPDAGLAVKADGSKAKLDNVVFNYLAQEHKQVVNYVDVNDSTHVVSGNTIKGKTNTDVAFTPQAPVNWVIVDGQNVPSEIHFGTTDNQPITVLVKHGQKFDAKGDSRVVTRTVQYVDPESSATKLVNKQSVTLTRSTTTDLVTGKVSYGDWNTGVFKQVNAPKLVGYNVINGEDGAAEVVNGNTNNKVVTFRYAAEMFNQVVNYIDEDSSNVVSSTNVAGQTNSTVIFDANSNIPSGYNLAKDQNANITIKFGKTNPTKPANIYVVAKTESITAGTTKQVERNIYVNLGDNSKNTLWTVQNVTLHRSAERNVITGAVTYGEWSDADMPAYAAPEIKNYAVTNPDAGKAVHVTGNDDQLQDVVFNYTANHQKITNGIGTQREVKRQINVKLGDNDIQSYATQSITLTRTGDKNLATGEIVWGAWSTDTMPAYAAPSFPAYTVTNPDAGSAVKIGNDSDVLNAVTFVYKANTKEVTNGEGTEKTVSRDIYTKLDDAEPNKVDTQTVTLHRTGTQNLVTGVITWNAWQEGEVPAYIAPKIENYTIQNPDAGVAVRVDGSKNTIDRVVFNYTANHQQITTGEGTEKTVSRNIYTKLEGQDAVKHDIQTVTLHRTGDKNLATGEIAWGAWNTDTMSAYTAPKIENYTVTNPDAAPSVTITGSTKGMNVTFNYTANHETITDGDGTHMTVSRDIYTHLEGQNDNSKVTTQTVTLHRTGDKNLATGEITWGAWNTDTMSAYTAPKIENYTVTNPDAAPEVAVTSSTKNMNVVFNYSANHETVTDGDGTHMSVTRDINVQLGDQAAKKVDAQVVTLHRTGDKNLATGKITWGAWSTDTMKAYTAPEYKNYTVQNPDAAPEVAVNSSTKNMSVTFKYAENHEKITDGEGTTMVVSRDIYTKLDDAQPTKHDTQTITLHRIGDKNLVTGQIKWGDWEAQDMPAYAAPEVKNYTVTNPDAGSAVKADGSRAKLDNVVFNYSSNHQQITTGEGTEMTVTRDIYADVEGQGRKQVGHQAVELHRTGDKNLATGKIAWGAWTPATMGSFSAPEIGGYAVTNPDAASSVTVDGSRAKLDDVVFNYKANDQSVSVNYVDEETNKTITSIPVTGKTGQTVDFDANAHVPAGWVIVGGQNVLRTFTFGSTPLKDQTVLIHHNENDRYKVTVPAGENVTTHVGANENVPSLSASGVKLTWTENGKEVAAPEGSVVTWETVPATDKITSETGTLKVTYKDGTTTTVTIPVEVQGATAGDIQKVDQNGMVPEANTTVNTSTVDHFGITNVSWTKVPSTEVPGANIPGVARVNYNDGTYQDVNVVVDVRKVEDGRDHKTERSLYRETTYNQTYVDFDGHEAIRKGKLVHYRTRYTDFKYPVGDSRRVTYSRWITERI